MINQLNINALVPPPCRDGGLLGSYAMRYRAAHLVPCGGAFFIASPHSSQARRFCETKVSVSATDAHFASAPSMGRTQASRKI